ncbi:penicillin-binding protein [Streptomyces cinereoruber]|uniref:Class A beta-lactamase-related serine hydrolase n=1 Tax=Streptomyces cinereoruber TaxID=67260 RepID=A0AAV4KIJ6_9ACTN|nr:CubicO group peptidase (beta-lactamase class C family) [Streptomyces cinereoruber]MBY8816658.1 beta-lactamase family protein [Streptomyces cinereoruber]NIH65137.1 CubicO group peptidase (beta-lactamase class C family) [Streptomyces cinereoruber]QEV31124.1 class A beta-lactamase-related serine hydrolase [Streptomyces cinereoruber]GGR19071.1 penicillin-binding protein [Streptomyces cinereoruber]
MKPYTDETGPEDGGGEAPARVAGPPGTGTTAPLADRLAAAVASADAPDVVFAASVRGRRTLCDGGTADATATDRQELRYEIGSASKTFAGLLLACLATSGHTPLGHPVDAALFPDRPPGRDPVTLHHLITHTSGLPGLPRDLYLRALPRRNTNPYAGYDARRVVEAFARARPRRPGTRWRYSNFGVAVLGHALAARTATPWDDLLREHVLAPLGLSGTALRPGAEGGRDATGHAKDGTTPLPPLDIAGFAAAGAVRATPHDLLAFLEAHLEPSGPLADALREVRRPVLSHGRGEHRQTHTLTWFQQPTPRGPAYFHCGATPGQQAFLGFCPATGFALAAVSTRRYRPADPFSAEALTLLCEGP